MGFMRGFLPKKPLHFLVIALLLETTYLLFLRDRASGESRIQHATTAKHVSAALILSSKSTIHEFGVVAKKATVLGHLAEHYVDNPSLDPAELSQLMAEQFPWWNISSLQYFPWKRKSWHKSTFADTQLFHSETGIVISVGDRNAREAAHLIGCLRNIHKSRLPIDIAYAGDEDLTPRVRTFLWKLGKNIHFIDLTKVFDESLVNLGLYAIKPFALLASRYPQTILMDADAVFFSRPDRLFQDYPGLRDTGALFFHDRTITNRLENSGARRDWLTVQLQAAGRKPSAHLNESSLFYRRYIGEEVDAAVVAVDKSRPKTYIAMAFACWMNVKEVRDAITWKLWHGEKETYWLAAEMMGVPYSFEPWSSARILQSRSNGVLLKSDDDSESPKHPPPSTDTGKRCTKHMVHSDATGKEPLWANDGLWMNKDDKNLGLANWTHWYLGTRIDKALSDFSPKSKGGDDEDGKVQKEEQLMHQQQIMATQQFWNNEDWDDDAKSCPRYNEKKWKRLDADFRTRLERMIEEVRSIEVRYKNEVTH